MQSDDNEILGGFVAIFWIFYYMDRSIRRSILKWIAIIIGSILGIILGIYILGGVTGLLWFGWKQL